MSAAVDRVVGVESWLGCDSVSEREHGNVVCV